MFAYFSFSIQKQSYLCINTVQWCYPYILPMLFSLSSRYAGPSLVDPTVKENLQNALKVMLIFLLLIAHFKCVRFINRKVDDPLFFLSGSNLANATSPCFTKRRKRRRFMISEHRHRTVVLHICNWHWPSRNVVVKTGFF